MNMKKRVQVLVNLEPLMKMDRAELATQWQSLFKVPTPRGAQVDLLRRVLAWKLQSNNLERDSAEKFVRALRRWSRSAATVMHFLGKGRSAGLEESDLLSMLPLPESWIEQRKRFQM